MASTSEPPHTAPTVTSGLSIAAFSSAGSSVVKVRPSSTGMNSSCFRSPVPGVLVRYLAGLPDTARGAGNQDQARTAGVESGSRPQRQAPGSADHLAGSLGGHQLHAHRPAGGGSTGVQHLVGGDDIERIEAVEQDDLGVHATSFTCEGPVCTGWTSTLCTFHSTAQWRW